MGSAAAIATPLLIAFGVAIAGWALYKAIQQLTEIEGKMAAMERAQARGVKATKEQTSEMEMLETVLKRAGKATDNSMAAMFNADATDPFADYIAKLKEAVGQLDQFKGKAVQSHNLLKGGKIDILAAGAAYMNLGESAAKAGVKSGQSAKATEEAAKRTKKAAAELASAFNVLGVKGDTTDVKQWTAALAKIEAAYKQGKVSADDWAKAQEAAFQKVNSAALQLDKLENSIHGLNNFKQLKAIFSDEYFKNVSDGIKAQEEVHKAFEKLAASSDAAFNVKWAKAGIQDVSDLAKALKTADVEQENLQARALELGNAYKIIQANVDGLAVTQLQADKARANYLEAEIRATKERGDSTRALQKELDALNKSIGEHGGHVKAVSKAWGDFSKEVSTIITNFSQDVGKTLFDGTKDWGAKFTKIWRDLKEAVVSSFIQPLTAALTKFTKETLESLLTGDGLGGIASAIGGIGKAINSVFGGGASGGVTAVSNASRGSQNVAGALMGLPNVGKTAAKSGSSASSVAGAVASPAAAWVGAIGSIANAIVSGIGLARLEGTMNQVEQNTAEGSIHLQHLLETSNKFWPYLELMHVAHFEFMAAFASLMTTVEDIRSRIDTLGDSLGEAQQPLVDAVAALPDGERQFAEVIIQALEALGHTITDAIRDGVTGLSDVLRTLGVSGGAGGADNVGGQLRELNKAKQDLLDQQEALLKQMPKELADALRAGQVGNPADAAESALVRSFNYLHDQLMAIEHDLNSIRGQHIYAGSKDSGSGGSSKPAPQYDGAVDPATGSLDPSKVKTTINATVVGGGGGVDTQAIAVLHEMINANFITLFDILTEGKGLQKSGVKAEQATQEAAEKIADGQPDMVEAIDTNTIVTAKSMSALSDDIIAAVETVAQPMQVGNTALGGPGAVFGSDSLTELVRSFKAAGYNDNEAFSHLRSIGLEDVATALDNAGTTLASAVDSMYQQGINTVAQLQSAVLQHGANAFTSIPTAGGSSLTPIGLGSSRNGFTVNVGSIRGRDDVDYLVGRLNEMGVR